MNLDAANFLYDSTGVFLYNLSHKIRVVCRGCDSASDDGSVIDISVGLYDDRDEIKTGSWIGGFYRKEHILRIGTAEHDVQVFNIFNLDYNFGHMIFEMTISLPERIMNRFDILDFHKE